MGCGCQGNTAGVYTSSAPEAQPMTNSSVEYVVRLPDGSYSGDLGSMQAAFEYAAIHSGQARARAKKLAPA